MRAVMVSMSGSGCKEFEEFEGFEDGRGVAVSVAQSLGLNFFLLMAVSKGLLTENIPLVSGFVR